MIGRADVWRAALAAERLGAEVEAYVLEGWPLRSVRAIARATSGSTPARLVGYGGGTNVEEAFAIAISEYVERFAQFRAEVPPPEAVAAWNTLRGHALSPLAFGLYERVQYAAPGFPCQPFDPTQPLEWISVSDLEDGAARLIPIEFVYPNAPLARSRLVYETSSGCAAHVDQTLATMAALCEVIERDAAMLFWYRQPATMSLALEDVGSTGLDDVLEQVRELGYVVLVANLDYDLGIPCFLAIALQGDRVAYGLGCHANAREALLQAVDELGRGLAWLHLDAGPLSERRSFAAVQRPDHHYKLYNCGPRHGILRQILARTLQPRTVGGPRPDFTRPALPVRDALNALLQALSSCGLRAYGCDITPPSLREIGLHVVRVLVPGLVPLHFGFDLVRLGCARLCGPRTPGRLCHLLPHFIH
jgi:ribosomal protein S12 methylthiotransferase accessory factor